MVTTKPTMVQLTEPLLERLDARAGRERISRSRLIRDAVEAYLAGDTCPELEDRYRRAYEAEPLDEPEAWGSIAAWHRGLASARGEAAVADAW